MRWPFLRLWSLLETLQAASTGWPGLFLKNAPRVRYNHAGFPHRPDYASIPARLRTQALLGSSPAGSGTARPAPAAAACRSHRLRSWVPCSFRLVSRQSLQGPSQSKNRARQSAAASPGVQSRPRTASMTFRTEKAGFQESSSRMPRHGRPSGLTHRPRVEDLVLDAIEGGTKEMMRNPVFLHAVSLVGRASRAALKR